MSKKGFTLVEIMLVLAILAGIAVFGVPRLMKTDQKINQTIRKMTILSRQLHNKARIEQITYRIAVQLGAEKESAFWVESAPRALLISEEDEKEIKEDKLNEKVDKVQFKTDEKIIPKQKLPKGFVFNKLETLNNPDGFTEGVAYIYYFPQGLVEEVALHITNNDQFLMTVITKPLTGHMSIIKRDVSLKEINQK